MARDQSATDAAAKRYERERSLVELLMLRRGIPVEEYINPNEKVGVETGADVLAVVEGRRIGVQVTELDTGDEPGRARAAEKALWRGAQAKTQGTYGHWAQNDVHKLVAAISRAVVSKAQHVVGCDESWLLISAGVPELGSLVSTFVVTQWLGADALDAATSGLLAKSQYRYVFLHVIVGNEDALYCWSAGGNWQKATRTDAAAEQGLTFWDVQPYMQKYMRGEL